MESTQPTTQQKQIGTDFLEVLELIFIRNLNPFKLFTNKDQFSLT